MLYTHLATLFLIAALAFLAWTDLRSFRLPDLITIPLAAIGLAVNTLIFQTPVPALLGFVLGYASLVALELGFRYLRGIDGLGRGDAKLLAAGGAWCTAWFLPVIALIGSATALSFVFLVRLIRGQPVRALRPVAFGPWLALGILICWIWRAYFSGAPFPV